MLEPTIPGLAPLMDVPRPTRRLRRPAFVIIAIFAGLFFAFVVSTLLASSANAAPETGLSSPIPGHAGPVVAASTLAKHLSPVVRSTSKSNPMITSVTSPTRLATSMVATVANNVSSAVGPLVSRVARTVNRSVPAVSPTQPLPGAAPRARTSSPAFDRLHRVGSAHRKSARLQAVTTRVVANPIKEGGGSLREGGNSLRFALTVLGSPPALPLRSPALPARNIPAMPGTPGEGLPSSHGSGQFGSILSMGLLLPASLEGTASPGKETVPHLLLDLRQSPPG